MPATSKVKNIFLAEDDEDDVVIFIEILSDITKDVNVTVAANGIELISLLKKSEILPEVIFLDVNMPLKNGFQCLQEKRAVRSGRVLKQLCIPPLRNRNKSKKRISMELIYTFKNLPAIQTLNKL